MRLDMLLEILGSLEGLAAEITLVGFQGHMNTDVRSDVISLDRGGTARVPLACEVQVVGALAANMTLTNVFLCGSQNWKEQQKYWPNRQSSQN